MNPDQPYIETLACFAEHPPDIRTYVVRALTVQSLAELAADLIAAETHGQSIETVLSAWSCVYD